jgi:hypothetical protein
MLGGVDIEIFGDSRASYIYSGIMLATVAIF